MTTETVVRVRLTGDHPHTGEYGTITSVNGKFPVIYVLGQQMFEVSQRTAFMVWIPALRPTPNQNL